MGSKITNPLPNKKPSPPPPPLPRQSKMKPKQKDEPMYDFLFHQGQRVICEVPNSGNKLGKIVGCQSIPLPVIGRLYIVQFDESTDHKPGYLLDKETYPFNTICIPEIYIKPSPFVSHD